MIPLDAATTWPAWRRVGRTTTASTSPRPVPRWRAWGATTPAQMATMLTATRAAVELYATTPNPRNWLLTALIAKWGVDQVISNAVSVTLGPDTFQFVKQPSGVFTPPAKATHTLLKTNAVYWLQERNGRTFKFDAKGRLTNLVDQYSQPLTVAYVSSTSSLPQTITDWKGRTLTFNYTSNRLTSVSDNTGRVVSYGYTANAAGQWDLTSAADAESKTNRFLYDTNHQIIATVNALGQTVTSNRYDNFGRVIEQYSQGDTNQTWRLYWSGWENVEEDPAGGQRRFCHDDKVRLVAQADALGNMSRTAYDGQDHVTLAVSPLNETNRFEYDGRHNLLRTVDALNFTNQFVYDTQDRLVRTVDARGNTNRSGYNAKHQITGTTNGAGDWTTFAYDGTTGLLTNRSDAGGATGYGHDTFGLLNSIAYPVGLGGETLQNHPRGDVTNHTNARGFPTAFQYNARRELTNTAAPTNLTAKVLFDAAGNVLATTDARQFTRSNTWSATHKLLATVMPGTPQGVPGVTNSYDSRDWLTRTLNPLQQPTWFTNDAAGRLVAARDPLGRATRSTLDADGRTLGATNAANEVMRQEWNARGELAKSADGANRTVLHVFDAAGNQVTLTNRNQKRWQFQFDAANRLTNTITPMGRTNSKTYNNRGLLASAKEPSGDTATLTYDPKGRLTNCVDGVASVVFRYDANNNVTNLVENGRTNTWTFDAYDCVQSYRDADGYVLGYRYDANGNLTNLIYPGNRVVSYAYDSLNRLTNVTDWAQGQTHIEYDLASRVRKVTRPNQTVREIHYDDAGQTTNIVERMGNGVPIAFFKLNWNDAGRMAWEFAAPLPHSNAPPTRTMTFDDDNRLLSFNAGSVTHDADGNMTYGPGTNSTFVSYGYNARNQLTNAAGVSCGYDPAGNRVTLTNGASVTRFVVDPNAALSQVLMRVRSGVTNYYIHGLGLVYEVTETASSTNTLMYHFDYRGSTVALSGSNGVPTDRIEYSAYGTTTYRSGTNDTPFLFNGRYGVQTDPNGLLYMQARYYNPFLCRFLNADPAGFVGGLNFFAYANGNPISHIDPNGLWVGADDAVFALGGGVIGVGGRLVGDLVTGTESSTADYIGAFVGGAAGGETLLYTANPFAAGAAGGAAGNLTSQGLKLLADEQESFSFTSLGIDTGLGTATGFIPGGPRIGGFNAGRGSDLQVFRQIVTKAENGTINNIATGTAFKMANGAFYEYAVVNGTLASSIGSTLISSPIPGLQQPSLPLASWFPSSSLVHGAFGDYYVPNK